MSALDDLINKPSSETTALDWAAIRYGDGGEAAEELAALRAENARLRRIEQAALAVFGNIQNNWVIEKLQPGETLETDLKSDNILALAAALEGGAK
jgi:hypothetical protein